MNKAIQQFITLLHKALTFMVAAALLTACQAQPEGKRYSVYAYNYTDYSISQIVYGKQQIDPGIIHKAVHEKFTHESTGEKIIKDYSWAGSWCCRSFPTLNPNEKFQIEIFTGNDSGRFSVKTWAYVADFKLGVDSNVTLHIYPDWHVEIDGTAMSTAEPRPPLYKPDAAHAPVIGELIPWEKKDGQ